MVIKPAPFPAFGFDCVTVMTAARATALKAAGMTFAIRYLGSVTASELAIIMAAGLMFMPVTFSRAPGWIPTAAMGTSDGNTDVQHLKSVGVPEGCTVWIDLEGTAGSAQAVAAWVNARAAVIKAAGYDVGLYVGSGDVLNGQQLYALAELVLDVHGTAGGAAPTSYAYGWLTVVQSLRAQLPMASDKTTFASSEAMIFGVEYMRMFSLGIL